MKIIILMLLMLVTLGGITAGEPDINIFSGIANELPWRGHWELLTEQKKNLAGGEGKVVVNLPDLPPDSFVNAELMVNRQLRARVRIWSRQFLDGMDCVFQEQGNYLQNKLKKYFIDFSQVKKDNSAAKVIISDKFMIQSEKTVICILPASAFPIRLSDKNGSTLTLQKIPEPEMFASDEDIIREKKAMRPGLGVIWDEKGGSVALNGKSSFVIYKSNGATVVIVSPYVNWENISVLLWLRNIVKNSR